MAITAPTDLRLTIPSRCWYESRWPLPNDIASWWVRSGGPVPAGGGGGLPGDGLLPPAATMSAVPNRDGVGMPVDGIIPEGELFRARDQGSVGSRRGLSSGRGEGERAGQAGNPAAGSAGANYQGQRYEPRQRFPSNQGNRGRYRPTPQPSPFNPYPAGPGTPYPVAPYYDG